MLLHVYDGGSYVHISKFYKDLGIPAKFVAASYLRPQDFVGCESVVVDSLRSLAAVENKVSNAKLYVGGKPTFKAMMGSSIITKCNYTGTVFRLMAGMSYKFLYSRLGKIIYAKLLKKITHPHKYLKLSKPNINVSKSDADIMSLAEARAASLGGVIVQVSIDVETKQEAIITSKEGDKSYWIYSMIELFQATFATRTPRGEYDLWTVVIPFKTQRNYDNITAICMSKYPKSTSNGHYDIEQLLHWRIPVYNWLWDVEYYARSVTPDLKGFYSLGMTAGIWLRDVVAWKDLTDHKTDRDMAQQKAFLLYSGLDTHNTAAIALQQMHSAKGQNLKNYMMKREFDGLTCFMNLQLLPVDKELNEKMLEDATIKRQDNAAWFKDATGLNPGQDQKLMVLFKRLHLNLQMLGYKDLGKLDSLQEKNLSGLQVSHPFISAAIEKFLDAKHGEKDGSTFLQYIKYYCCEDHTRQFPYFDYSMNQYIAKTMRYASSSSNAWCGGNVMNISGYYRQQYYIPEGQVGVSIDAPQSEARTVGYLAECLTIINVLENPELDYHIFNAANAVFIKPYETITKVERTLSKPAGFGFFYGQSWHGLMLTLGVEAMRELRDILGLPETTPLSAVAKKVSSGIDSLYWEIRKRYYPVVVEKYRRTSRVPCITGYAPLLTGDIGQGETVRTVVCIDGQHTSAHINMVGGVRMLYGFLYGDTPIERETYPYLQLHDEIQARTSARFTVGEIDDYTEKLFANKYIVNGRVLTIPRGVPVFGMNLGVLKEDEIPRTEEVRSLTLQQAVDNYKHGEKI